MSKLIRKRDLSPREVKRIFKELYEIHCWSSGESSFLVLLRNHYEAGREEAYDEISMHLLLGLSDKIAALRQLQKDLWEEVAE